MICLRRQPDTRSRIILELRAPPELGVGLWAALSYLTGGSAATAAEMGQETGQQRDPSETCVPVPVLGLALKASASRSALPNQPESRAFRLR